MRPLCKTVVGKGAWLLVPDGGRFQAIAIYAWECTCIGLSGIQGVEEVKNREMPTKESFSPEKESFSPAIFLSEISPFRHQLPSHPQPVQLDTEEFVARPASPFLAPIWEESRVWSGVEGA